MSDQRLTYPSGNDTHAEILQVVITNITNCIYNKKCILKNEFAKLFINFTMHIWSL